MTKSNLFISIIFILNSLIVCIILTSSPAHGAVVEYNLTIEEKEVNINAKTAEGMTINGGIPGPALRFKEGDFARIHIHNRMSVETSIHWHGVLVPPHMDGVPYVSFPPIRPDTTFTYEFPVRQSGTYWYHSHTSLQEQSGVYGAIVIEPEEERIHYDREYVVLLSDWTKENPDEVLRTLKRGSEWYSIEKGTAQSVLGAVKSGMAGDYFKRELMRMPPMDLSDVAYDYFLINGSPEIEIPASEGETILLRVINGSAMTYFHIETSIGHMSVVAADGQDVEPFEVKRLLVSVAETYDLLVKMPSGGAFEFRATAHDNSGFASLWLGSGMRNPAPDVPSSNLYMFMGRVNLKGLLSPSPAVAMGMSDMDIEAGRFDKPGMLMHSEGMDMGSMGHNMEQGKGHKVDMHMEMSHEMQEMSDIKEPHPEERGGKKSGKDFRPLASDVSTSKSIAIEGSSERPLTPYYQLRSTKPTSYLEDKPVQEIRFTLDGDMERYVWFLNNKPLSESDVIRIKGGHIIRFIMVNRTMMHHPMHLHGHFFRVINGQKDYAPLKHTVDVAPMSTTVIEFYSNEPGDWFFHCHLLYHMKAGMARVIHYENFVLSPQIKEIRPELYKETSYAWGQADVLTNMTQGSLVLSNTRNIVTAEWEAGWEKVSSIEWETTFTYDRYLSRFLTAFAGFDILALGSDVDDARIVMGIRYLLPLNIESRVWVDSDSGGRLNLAKALDIVPRIKIYGEWQYDTHTFSEGRAGLRYLINKNISLIGQWHSEYGIGGGLQVRF